MPRSISTNRPMLASSSGASILVEQAERARLVLEHAEHQRDRGQRLLAAREQLHALQPLARRLAMISMPLSSGSFSSSSVRPARPPPNSVLNVSGSCG
jgi:hypothetical protein